ncbi:MAG: hypothetical protein JJ939_15440 [Alphaproteobacteria bacterium]|nr:hypothetical protein [Alphaproteobacteria bacterium]MBO6629809.1 hypothetical protein [Alphaproteobacteria bacterium]MDF1627252.1 hypothetical protein [Parvibaculaceae bacterium]
MLEQGNRWSVRIGGLLAAAAAMGCLNSVLQLLRFKGQIGERLMEQDWFLISVWLGLLVFWALVLGLIVGVYAARHWFIAQSSVGAMSPSD